jgi:diguanylate cyclase (GGDEF)-like protein/PAS domain S-box-containing protein
MKKNNDWKLSAFLNTALGAVVAIGVLIALVMLLLEVIRRLAAPLNIPEPDWSLINIVVLIATVLPALYLLVFREKQQSSRNWDDLSEQAADAIFTYSPQMICISANQAACDLLGYTREEFLTFGMRDLVHPDDLVRLGQPDELQKLKQMLDGKITINAQRRLRHKDGRYITVEIHVKRLSDGRILSIKRDITARAKAEEEIRQLAFYDALTQLPNRRLLGDRIEQILAAGKRSGLYGALMLLDLDNFKTLNDTYGHSAGDLLLKEVAQRISHCVRETDTVARLGGDEFVVVLSELDKDESASIEQVKLIGQKILYTLSEPYAMPSREAAGPNGDIEHLSTASIGAILLTPDNSSAEDILVNADIAMYRAKDRGGNRLNFFTPE